MVAHGGLRVDIVAEEHLLCLQCEFLMLYQQQHDPKSTAAEERMCRTLMVGTAKQFSHGGSHMAHMAGPVTSLATMQLEYVDGYQV